MARSAVLNVQVLVDAAKAAGELNQTAAKFESFGKKIVGAAVGAFAIKGITELAKSVVSSASQMEQAMGGTDKVFGTSASQIHTWAADTSDSIRLPAAAVEKYAVLIKTQLAATGQPMGALVTQTKALIQVGADLAAVTGADLADSIAAVKSALAGEYDPIQNLGVAMTAATVNTKALAIAHGDAALAASSSVQAQARVAEIMEKSAFATGAAAEESNTFQAKVDALKEKLSTLAVAVGGPMLDSLAGMVGGMGDAAASASTLGTGLGTMLGAVLSLPGPIQAIVIALVALIAVSAKWGTAAAAGVTTLITNLKAATTSATGFKAALSGIGSALAGGALLLGVGAVIAAIAIAIGRVTEAANKGKDALSGYVSALVASGNKSSDASSKAFKQALLASDAYRELTADGFSAAEAVNILSGTQENWHAVMSGSLGTIHNLNRDTMALVDGFIDANGAAGGLAQAQIDGAAAMGLQADATDGSTTALDANAQAAANVEAMTKKMNAALDVTKNFFNQRLKNDMASQMLADLDLVSQKAERASTVIHAALEKAFPGRTQLQDNGVSQLVTQVQEAGDLIKQEDLGGQIKDIFVDIENMDPIKLAFLGDAGQQVQQWSGGFRDAWDQMVVDLFEDAGGNVDSAVDAVLHHTESMIGGVADQLGISMDDARQVVETSIGKIDATTLRDKVLKITAEDQEAFEKTLFYQSITFDPVTLQFKSDIQIPPVQEIVADLNKKYGLIPPTPVGVTPQIKEPDALQKLLAGAVAKTGTVPGPPVSPTLDPTKVDQGLGQISATDTPATVTAVPETAAATTAIDGIANQKRDTALNVGANTTIYQQAVSALIADTPNRQALLTVTANTAQADASINATASAQRINTINVIANPAMANATINATAQARRIATIETQANVAPAVGAILQVMNGRYRAVVVLEAYTYPALSAILQLMNASYRATITVVADVGQAQQAIRNVTGASYSATVRVNADTSAYMAAFNSLPTTRTITQTVVTQAAPAPAPAAMSFAAAPQVLSRMAAPSTMARAMSVAPSLGPVQTQGSGTTGLTVNINGGIESSDAIARAVKRVVLGRDRRTGGVVVGDTRARIGHS
jgi:hypothetical protein